MNILFFLKQNRITTQGKLASTQFEKQEAEKQ